MIKITRLNKFYNKNRSNQLHVLNDISLELPDSGMVAIFGRSGCGKTTLLNAIGGLDRTNSGKILIDGERIDQSSDTLRNKRIGYIFQNYNLSMDESCFDNVADALRLCGMTDEKEISSRTLAALRNVGMENYKLRTPDTLSGGQMQRIAIARAIVKNPRIILADEPTGNLDEANTVMIMDLLKQISQTHLVILVTHEANLVDYYCDRVIELSDGKLVGERINSTANGYSVKSKNDIYLGELDKTELNDGNVTITQYSDGAVSDIKLRIINYQGKCYLSIDTPSISVLDSTSEIKLREGVYKAERTENELSADIDMSDLPPIKDNDSNSYGRLFGLKSAVKSGLENVFQKKKKRGQKLLRFCMLMFAFVIVFISSLQGTAFKQYFDARSQYSENVFYVYTPNHAVGDKLISSLGKNGIEYMRICTNGYKYVNTYISFTAGKFETYTPPSVSANVMLLPFSLMEYDELLAGSADITGESDMIISSLAADKLLSAYSLGYVKDYKDIIGSIARTSYGTFTVKGIFESDQPIAYISDNAAAKLAFEGLYDSVERASDLGYTVSDGSVTFINVYQSNLPDIGSKVTIYGREYTISNVIDLSAFSDYRTFLEASGYGELVKVTDNYQTVCWETVEKENPNASYDEISELAQALYRSTYFEQLERYYAYVDEYLSVSTLINGQDYYTWVYLTKGIEIAKYVALDDMALTLAYDIKTSTGSYPMLDENGDKPFYDYDRYYEITAQLDTYFNEFNADIHNSVYLNGSCAYLMSDNDFALAGSSLGTCDEGIITNTALFDPYDEASDQLFPFGHAYTMVYSSDPTETARYLESEFSTLPTPSEYYPPVASSETLLAEHLKSEREGIIASIVTLLVFIAVLSLCVYIIMRSALMGRIKEIGIYRAIGVSRRNLIFRAFIETAVLTTLSVFVGYLISSWMISSWIASSSLIAEIFYYPSWMALGILVILYGVCVLSGLIPILLLLRKTPSEILAKYDI